MPALAPRPRRFFVKNVSLQKRNAGGGSRAQGLSFYTEKRKGVGVQGKEVWEQTKASGRLFFFEKILREASRLKRGITPAFARFPR